MEKSAASRGRAPCARRRDATYLFCFGAAHEGLRRRQDRPASQAAGRWERDTPSERASSARAGGPGEGAREAARRPPARRPGRTQPPAGPGKDPRGGGGSDAPPPRPTAGPGPAPALVPRPHSRPQPAGPGPRPRTRPPARPPHAAARAALTEDAGPAGGRRGGVAARSPRLLRGGAGDGGGSSRFPFSFSPTTNRKCVTRRRVHFRPVDAAHAPRPPPLSRRFSAAGPSAAGRALVPRPRTPGARGTGTRLRAGGPSCAAPGVRLARLGCSAASAPLVSPWVPARRGRRCGRTTRPLALERRRRPGSGHRPREVRGCLAASARRSRCPAPAPASAVALRDPEHARGRPSPFREEVSCPLHARGGLPCAGAGP